MSDDRPKPPGPKPIVFGDSRDSGSKPSGPKPIVFGDSRDGGEKFRPRPIVLPSETMPHPKTPGEILGEIMSDERKPREINLSPPPPDRAPRGIDLPSPPPPPITMDTSGRQTTPRPINISPPPPPPPRPRMEGYEGGSPPPRAIDILASHAPATPARDAPRPPRAMGEDPRFQRLLAKGEAAQPQIASDIRFKARLNDFLGRSQIEWVNWGTEVLTQVAKAADAQGDIGVIITQANVAHWCDEVTAAFNAPRSKVKRGGGNVFDAADGYIPSVLDKIGNIFAGGPKYLEPSEYETKLNVGKNMLSDGLMKCMRAEEALRDKIHTLGTDSLVLEVFKNELTDAGDLMLIDNKHRTFIQAMQTAQMQLQAFENYEGIINKQIASCDQLLFNLIPQWKLSYQQQRPSGGNF